MSEANEVSMTSGGPDGAGARTPLWREIAQTLSGEIGKGAWRTGDKLPSEAVLARRFGVNRHTVRRGLADLAEGGLVHARKGAGVFVAAPVADYPIGRRVRFTQAIAAAGRVPGRAILSIERRAADPVEAEALRLPQAGDPVVVCEGIALSDGWPVSVFRSVFPVMRMTEIAAALAREGSVTRALAACHVPDYVRASTRLQAVAATALQAARLRVEEGAPLLRAVAVNADLQGVPVEYGTTWFAGDRVALTVEGEGALSHG
jgi:GntR family phosphonate transport system transcriptional regulator